MDKSTLDWMASDSTEPDYLTMVTYTADGETDQYEINFPGGYLNKADIKAYMFDPEEVVRTDLAVEFVSENLVKLTPAQAAGNRVTIYRDTPKELPLVSFTDGAMIEARNLDRNAKQCIFAVAEILDKYNIVYSQVELAELYATSAAASATSAAAQAALVQSIYDRFQVTDELIAEITTAVTQSNAYAAVAQQSADRAETAADRAESVTDVAGTYPDVATGLAATAVNKYFRVPQGVGNTVSFIYYVNDAGVAREVSSLPGASIVEDLAGSIQQAPLSPDLVVFTDSLGFSHSRIRQDGGFETPLSLLGANEISSGNLSIVEDPNFDSDELILSDGIGFSIPASGDSDGGAVDPGEVTVELPPQSAAYGLLSKMRAALEDVCVIINSDSTGITQDTDPATGLVFKKWTRKLAEFLAANYPAYTVNYYSWSSNAYTTPETLQIGTEGKTLHFYNAAVAGTQPLYLMGQYFEAAYVPRQADLIIFNHGHNTDNNVPASTHMGMDLAILYTMLQRHPNAGAVIVSQNPLRDNNNGTVRSNGARQAAITAGFSLVDAFQMFQNAGKPTGWYMDNIHPNSVGDAKIFDLVKNLFVWPSSPSRYVPGLTAGVNLLKNADFTTWGDGLDSPDGWTLTGCTAEKDTVNFESGDYGLKLVSTGTIEAYAAYSLPASLVKRLRGKTVTLAARVFIPTTSTRGNCGAVQIPEVTNNRPYGTPNGGRGGFIWKATVITVPTTATALTVRAVLDTSGGAVGNWCTFDRLTLSAGNIPQDFY